MHPKVEPPSDILLVLALRPRVKWDLLLLMLHLYKPKLLESGGKILLRPQRLPVCVKSFIQLVRPAVDLCILWQAAIFAEWTKVDLNMFENSQAGLQVALLQDQPFIS